MDWKERADDVNHTDGKVCADCLCDLKCVHHSVGVNGMTASTARILSMKQNAGTVTNEMANHATAVGTKRAARIS